MNISSLLHGGDARTAVYPLPLVVLYIGPLALMAMLVSTKRLSTPVKQFLSIPLLLAQILVPINFTARNGVYDIASAAVGYNSFLRFFELFWIAPILYGKPAYADMDYLHKELWSSMRTFPKDGDKKEYIKDKKFYHILIYLGYHMFICDVFGAWINTYSSKDAMEIPSEPPLVYFVTMAGIIYVFGSAFNTLGYSLQLFYVIYYEGGSYSQEQWRPLMMNPIWSTSLDDLWSHRWHQLFRSQWVAFGFRPVRYITKRVLSKSVKNPLPISLLTGSLAVFVASGMMHEYMVYCNVGWSIYHRFFMGQQMYFFFIHGLGMALERLMKKAVGKYIPTKSHPVLVECIQHVWTVGWAYYTFPFFMNGFAYWGLWHGNPFQILAPHVLRVLRAAPSARALCGSLL